MAMGGMIGIMTAMPDEAGALLDHFGHMAERSEHGRRVYTVGELWGRRVVVVVSRCGKVAAATTATELIVRFGVDALICTGLAGGLGRGVAIGDVVVADRLVQHDLDARPLWPRHVVPLLETGEFETDPGLTASLVEAARRYENDGRSGRVHCGLIASGDQFVHGPVMGDAVRGVLPEALCVEMEGAAVAQVCHEYGVRCGVFRAISDRADGDAPADFGDSLGAFAASHTCGILSHMLGAGSSG